MDKNRNQLIWVLVILTSAFTASMIWLIILEQEREKAFPNSGWGSTEEIVAAVVTGLFFVGIIGAAALLQKVIDSAQSIDTTQLPPLRHKIMLQADYVRDFFDAVPPRSFDKTLFSTLWDALFPPVVRLMIMCLIPLTLFMLGGLLFFVLRFAKDDIALARGEIGVCRGEVTHIEKKMSRSGTFYRVDYTYRLNDLADIKKGESYGDEKTVETGETVPVEYLVAEPAISRIKNMRSIPLNPFFPVLIAVALIFVLIPGFIFYIVLQRRFLKRLVINGSLVWGNLIRVRRGGRGIVSVRIKYELAGIQYSQKLVCPPVQGLYPPLAARYQKNTPVLLLACPSQCKKSYLFELHLLRNVSSGSLFMENI